MFKGVFEAVYNQLKNNTTLSAYLDKLERSFKENVPQDTYTIIIEPSNEARQAGKRSYPDIEAAYYLINIVAIMNVKKRQDEIFTGWADGTDVFKGLLEFTDDIRQAIREKGNDLRDNYNTKGYCQSDSNTTPTFVLTPTKRNLSIRINGRTPSGYETINCGTTTLSGVQVALNIQSALRSLGKHKDDGYLDAIATFNPANNSFRIESGVGPQNWVEVAPGIANDCSALLGFDNPTGQRGKNIIDYEFDTITVDNLRFPVRYRIIPLYVTEEIYVGG
jgi:hypothetical protein